MKVKIGRYKRWIGPYQIADLFRYIGLSEDRCHKIGDKLSNTWLMGFCSWIDQRRKRVEKVHIDSYDVWNMDSTLALIIHPMLVKLKESKQGSPNVDDEDVPIYLRSTSAPPKENEWDTDDNFHKRWDHIVDEMIWAFEQKTYDWESQYYDGKVDIIWLPVDENGDAVDAKDAKFFRMEEAPGHTFSVDRTAYDAHYARMKNGFRLFGKYYESLWD